MIEVLEALADRRRIDILRLLAGGERLSGEIAAEFEVTRPAVSQHLRVLREAGLVSVRRDGPRRWYSLRPEAFVSLREFLDGFWDDRLEELARAARDDEAATRG